MKVVHLNTTDFGGAAMAARHLHEALLERGVDSHLLTLARTRDDIPRHVQIEPFGLTGPAWAGKLRYKCRRLMEHIGVVEDRSTGPDNRNLRDRPPGHEIFTLPYSWFSVLDHPLVEQADVLHFHWTGQGLIDHADFFGRCTKSVVWTFHDMNPFTGGCHYAGDCTGYRDRCGDCPQLKDRRKAGIFWSYKRNALAGVPMERLRLVTPSRWLAGLAGSSSLMHGRTCQVVPNGFDTAHFHHHDRAAARRELGIGADRKVVLSSSLDVADRRKGMPLLLEALHGMAVEDLLLVRMGGNREGLADGPGVMGTGHIASAERLALHYAAADLFVLPSLADNLPNTICESLLCGTPVVAFNVGGIPEQVDDGTNGLLVNVGDVAGLRAAILRALSIPWDHVRIARQAALRYDRRTVAGAYMAIYQA